MRNYSSVVDQACTYHWYVDADFKSYDIFADVMSLFNRFFENPLTRTYHELTPSEQRVIGDFLRYAHRCRNRKKDFGDDHPGSFVYCNVNTGRTLVFVTWYGYGEFAGRTLIS